MVHLMAWRLLWVAWALFIYDAYVAQVGAVPRDVEVVLVCDEACAPD